MTERLESMVADATGAIDRLVAWRAWRNRYGLAMLEGVRESFEAQRVGIALVGAFICAGAGMWPFSVVGAVVGAMTACLRARSEAGAHSRARRSQAFIRAWLACTPI